MVLKRTAIDKYDFEDGVDYVKVNQKRLGQDSIDFTVLKNGNGTNAFIDYIVSIDMAKELCMISNTEKGKVTRRYLRGYYDNLAHQNGGASCILFPKMGEESCTKGM